MNEKAMEYEPRTFSSTYMGQDETDFTKWRFDVNEMLREFEHDLLGEIKVKDKDGEEKWENPTEYSATISKEGAREVISMCKTIVNKVTFLSLLDLNEIKMIMRNLNQSLVDSLFDNWKKWNVDKGRLDMIVVKSTRLMFIALKQAQGAKALDSLTKIEQIKRIENIGPKKEEGVRLSPFGRGREE